MDNSYQEFLKQKQINKPADGVQIELDEINPMLFDFQKNLVRFALRKGRSAIFADTGLGKSFMQIEWARLIGVKTLIIAPLSVARQTVREAEKLGIRIKYCRSQDEVETDITITNYEMMEKFDEECFGAVVLDESSILKSLAGKYKQKLIDKFSEIPYRLCCTATPSPNDISEIANHAEFLGIMSRAEMLSMYFVHDDDGWRLKGHAEEPFYRWIASWGMSIRKPSDLGFSDEGYDLPELKIIPVFIQTDYQPDDALFFDRMKGIEDRTKIRKATTPEKVGNVAELVNADNDQWIVWCGLNSESSLAAKMIPDAVNVEGNDAIEDKISASANPMSAKNLCQSMSCRTLVLPC